MAIVVKFGKKKTFTRSLIVFIFIRSCYITGLVRHSKGTKREGEDVIFYPKLQPNCRLLLALIRGKLTEETCHPSISAKFSYRKVWNHTTNRPMASYWVDEHIIWSICSPSPTLASCVTFYKFGISICNASDRSVSNRFSKTSTRRSLKGQSDWYNIVPLAT